MKNSIIFLLVSMCFFSCEKSKKNEQPVKVNEKAVFVLNEGNFGYGNASIDLYNPTNGNVDSKIFHNNNGRPLGDVLESMCIIDDLAYLVVNNSSKIEVVELPSFKTVGSIQNLSSPRILLPINSSKAYVSDFTANEIHIVDLTLRTKTASILTGGWIEGMVLSNDKVFACHAINDEVWVIDIHSDTVLSKIPTEVEPLSVVADKNGNVWVLCTGGFDEDFPTLLKIDAVTEQITQTITFTTKSDYPDNLQIDKAGETLYFLNKGLYKMSIGERSLPTTPFIPSNGRLIYSFGLNPSNGHIYLSDAIDYQQKGTIYHYDASGNELSTFKAGIIPGGFGFYNKK